MHSPQAPALAPGGRPQHALGRLVYSPARAYRLLRLVVVAVGIGLGLALLGQTVASLTPPHVYDKDFLAVYVLARAVADGTDPYLPLPILVERYLDVVPAVPFPHPSPHPPTAGVLFLPFAQLEYPLAATVWLGVELAFLIAAVYLLARSAGARLSPWGTLALATALIAWHPFREDLFYGQLMVLLLFLLAGARAALLSGRPLLGGTLVGVAMLVKPVPWPLLLLLALRRDWRALGASLSTILLGYLAAGWVIGLDRVASYFTHALPTVSEAYRASLTNQSLWTIGWRLFAGTDSGAFQAVTAPPLIESEAAAIFVSVAVPTLALLLVCLAVRRRSLDASLDLVVCLSIVASPIAWTHYLTLAAIPAAQVVRRLADRRLTARQTVAALLVAALLLVSALNSLLLAFFVAGLSPQPGAISVLPFASALLTLIPALSVVALGWLVATTDSVKRYA
ncbi:MAG: DUF2029 domain-containing protein [Chloroflexi bacterium]|nr:DUF2029 domain-containing protein [Chloroflexota bacterium]